MVALEPDQSHPTGKALCAKGRASPGLVDAADRLLFPFRRTRPKGDPDPGWQRIGWDEALDDTAAALRRIAAESGPEAVAFAVMTAAGTAISDAALWIYRLINAFGSPNNCNASEICAHTRAMAEGTGTGRAAGRTGSGRLDHIGRSVPRALEAHPYRVCGLVGFGANLLLSHADAGRGAAALRALDFHVQADLYLTPTAEFADIVLPIASAWEREGLCVGFRLDQNANELVQLRPAVVPARGETRADIDVVFDVAVRLGLAKHFWNGDVEAALRHSWRSAGSH
jgi:anaerobic selenocysteine-containing dehydrogenase